MLNVVLEYTRSSLRGDNEKCYRLSRLVHDLSEVHSIGNPALKESSLLALIRRLNTLALEQDTQAYERAVSEESDCKHSQKSNKYSIGLVNRFRVAAIVSVQSLIM